MKLTFESDFRYPPSRCRSIPFWSWNGKLDKNELAFEIDRFQAMGCGGFMMHSRTGLETEYLGKEWFDCIRFCVDEAKKRGMEAWLYDEDRWPSGYAGGIVTADPRFRRSRLLRSGETVAAPDSDWFNGAGAPDPLNTEAVERFIDVTHRRYFECCGDEFGRTVPAIFCDEPCAVGIDGKHLCGSAEVKKRFLHYTGRELDECAGELFTPGFSELKYFYCRAVTEGMENGFAGMIGQWCGDHNIALAGHLLREERLSWQALESGSEMAVLRHFQIPGMDMLSEYSRQFDTAKMVASVARQFGRTRRLGEIYGCTGLEFPFRGHKAVGDWPAALGINVRVPHLALYTLLGEAKRDFPGSLFYQAPWCESYRYVEDYFGRINLLNSDGVECRSILVVFPLESAWCVMDPKIDGQSAEMMKLEHELCFLRDALLNAHLDFDYGDEAVLADSGRVEDGLFKVGVAGYQAVVVPRLLTMRGSTRRLLDEFKRCGGKVVVLGSVPERIDLVKRESADIDWHCVPDTAALIEALAGEREISICTGDGAEAPGVIYQLRRHDDGYSLFVCNTGYSLEQQTPEGGARFSVDERLGAFDELFISGPDTKANPLELNLESGEIVALPHGTIKTSLAKLQSRMFFFPFAACDYPEASELVEVGQLAVSAPASGCKVTLSEPNVLLFDRFRCRLAGEADFQEDDVLRLWRNISGKLGLPVDMTQPWARRGTQKYKANIELECEFRLTDSFRPELKLALERPEFYTITLNGLPVAPSPDGWWCDRAFETVPLPVSALRNGVNTLRFSVAANEKFSGLESMYLLGGFRVDGTELSRFDGTLRFGDWTRQGLPYYSGAVTYHTELELPDLESGLRYFVSLGDCHEVAARISVNGIDAGVLGWEPWEKEVTSMIGMARNCRIDVEIFGHRRNSLGPLHLPGIIDIVHPGSFRDEAHWRDEPCILPCGLAQVPQIRLRRSSR